MLRVAPIRPEACIRSLASSDLEFLFDLIACFRNSWVCFFELELHVRIDEMPERFYKASVAEDDHVIIAGLAPPFVIG